jgi:EmrB/QacA subfamily drug resistance transporter
MTLLDVSIVNVALPSIKVGLGAGDNELQWIVSGYALTLGLLLVPSGRAGDAHGRRTVFMIGVALFSLASAVCGLAPSAGVLIAARLLQGCAGGLITPQISGFIQTLFRGQERGIAFGLFGTVVGISTAIGPLLGGALIALFGTDEGWRAVFFVNLPVGVVALVLAMRYLPAPEPGGPGRTELDPLGVLLLGSAVVCLLVPFIEQRSWHSPLRPALFGVAAVLLVLWVLHERRYGRRHEPLVSLDLFAIRSYVLGAGVGILYFAGFTGIFFILTQYLQLGLHYPAWKAGLSATPFAVGSALTAAIGGRQALRRGRKLVALGLGVVIAGLAAVWVAVGAEPGHDVALYTALPLLVAGMGGGLVDLAQPDADALTGAGAARGERGRRVADRPADRLGRRDRDHRQRLLRRAGEHARGLRHLLPARRHGDRGLRHRRPGAGTGRCADTRRLIKLSPFPTRRVGVLC